MPITPGFFGLLTIFALMAPESACLPVPSEVTLLSAGFAVGQGWFSFPAAVGAAVAGNLVGSLVAYAVGRHLAGRGEQMAKLAALRSCRQLLSRHGDAAVFIARLLPLARTFISLPAGYAGIGFRRFVLLTVSGCAIWCAALTGLGIYAGSGWRELASTSGRITAVAVVLGLLIWALERLRKTSWA